MCGVSDTSAVVRVVRASREDEPTLSHLLQLYVYDFSELLGLLPGDDGLFEVRPLGPYWSSPSEQAFLIRVDAKLAGFALLSRGSLVTDDPHVMDVAEFFVLRGARRLGVGRQAAHALFASFPGRWEVRVLLTNHAALEFWGSVVQSFSRGRFEQSEWIAPSGRPFRVLRFEQPRATEQ